MLIKLTERATGKCYLVNNDNIELVCVNAKGRTLVFLSKEIKEINENGQYDKRFMFCVEETQEDIYQQQFKT